MSFQDITNEHIATKRVYYFATHDSLTGLKNRSFLLERIKEAISLNTIHESALIYIDLNDFKLINDSYGHEVGDKILKVAAKRLVNSVRNGDVVARIGGDEFVLFLNKIKSQELLEKVAIKIQRVLNQPVSLKNNITIDLISSLGLSHANTTILKSDESQDVIIDNWLKSADLAMYTSKKRKDGSFAVFDEEFHRVKINEKDQFQQLRNLVNNNKVCIFFQPILKNERVYAVEALARFEDKHFSISPDKAINLAKLYNFQLPLFTHLFLTGLRAYKDLVKTIPPSCDIPFLNINIDEEMLTQANFCTLCLEEVTKLDLAPSQIYLEVTEKALEKDTYIIAKNLNTLKENGFKLSMDDFGTGYSSIKRLLDYSFDQLKIDRCFINGSPNSDKLRSALYAAVKLGEALNLEILGEGVESEEELKLTQEFDIPLIQGFYYCPPNNADLIQKYINSTFCSCKKQGDGHVKK